MTKSRGKKAIAFSPTDEFCSIAKYNSQHSSVYWSIDRFVITRGTNCQSGGFFSSARQKLSVFPPVNHTEDNKINDDDDDVRVETDVNPIHVDWSIVLILCTIWSIALNDCTHFVQLGSHLFTLTNDHAPVSWFAHATAHSYWHRNKSEMGYIL